MSVGLEEAKISVSDDDYIAWYGIAAGALFVAYLVIFLTTAGPDLWGAATTATANVLPVALLGLGARAYLRFIRGLRMRQRLAVFAAGAIVFAGAWYGMLAVFLGCALVLQARPFELVFLSGPGLIWQIYQGFVIFALVVVATALHGTRVAAAGPERASRTTLLVPSEDGLAPLAIADILAIEAADDQTIVHLRGRLVRVRRSLTSWARILDDSVFVRTHRSWIVNIEAALSIETVGGGRMAAHLPGGLTAPVSRGGAQALRVRSG